MERAITLADGSKYLEVGYRIADFRKAHPCGRIETKLLHITDNRVILKAEVYDKSDKLGEAYGMRQYTELDPYFTEVAETVAIGRALSDIGYNLFSYELQGHAPMERAIELDDGMKYLNVGYRVAWFRKQNPDAVILKDLIKVENGYAVVKATVVTKDGIILTTAHARRDWRDNEEGGHFFVESAETAAVGRAMTNLGYDIPKENNAENIEHNAYADSPIGRNPYIRQDQSPFGRMPGNGTSNMGFYIP